MATDDVNISEDAEMAECDGDKVVTMVDVLQEQQEFEDDANAVLGASDDKNCTYPKGYIKRQALYACLTCCTEAKVDPTKRAGVCLACSLMCHENHELIELYTKRNFRCDCGNPKFNSHPCQFTSDKTELNDDNIYNQNFSGLYCTCQRPYPDPESTIEDDMIQCIICEDWLHSSHLEAVVPANDQYSEMVCKSCMEKNEFLHDYSMFAVTAETGDVDIVTVNGDAKSADKSLCNGLDDKLVNGTEVSQAGVNGDVEMDEDKEKSEETVKDDTENNVDVETKQDNLSQIPNTDDSKINVNNDSKMSELEEQNVENTETKVQEETNESVLEKSNDKLDAVDDTTTADEKAENADITDNKMETIDNKQTTDETIKEQTETQEQISKQTTNEDGDGNNSQENKTDSNERTEQQLLDDLTELTADNTTSGTTAKEEVGTAVEEKADTNDEEKANKADEEKADEDSEEKVDSAAEEKTASVADDKANTASEENKDMENESVESNEQSENSKEKDDIESKEANATNESGDKSEDNTTVENKTDTGNIEVPDTSQTETVEKQSAEEKADLVMDAIDELLQTANEAKEKESTEKSEEPTSETTENKETNDNIETKASEDVEMSESEKKEESEVPEKSKDTDDSIDKPSASEDVEMSNTSTQNETPTESKVEEPTTNSEQTEEKVNDSISEENIALNETDQKLKTLNDSENELKTSKDNDSTNKADNSDDENGVLIIAENAKEHKRKLSTDLTDDVSSKKVKLECVRPKNVTRVHKGATFWPSNFRQKLCTCGECISMYKDLKVLFLTDLEDTVFAYESLGKENVAGGASQYEKGMLALSSLDRIQQINALTEYNRMRDKLLDFLKSFKDRKEIVKEEDIKAFFAGMKPRREPDGVYFCR
ncbi:hypothetical protein PYW07_001934 [Mythimna separata]|uniref:UBR-type domain-containing protein n=1 Tax=Mythimna separata TaxID=271217 RepID=A0AAD7YN03_MYTSE|nr:hypothetical protein PYW07_001934 [Mythimna separata]